MACTSSARDSLMPLAQITGQNHDPLRKRMLAGGQRQTIGHSLLLISAKLLPSKGISDRNRATAMMPRTSDSVTDRINVRVASSSRATLAPEREEICNPVKHHDCGPVFEQAS